MKQFIACLVLIGLGIVLLVKPQFMYEWTEGWKHAGDTGEPSQMYLWGNRIVGGVCILIGVGILIVSFLSQ